MKKEMNANKKKIIIISILIGIIMISGITLGILWKNDAFKKSGPETKLTENANSKNEQENNEDQKEKSDSEEEPKDKIDKDEQETEEEKKEEETPKKEEPKKDTIKPPTTNKKTVVTPSQNNSSTNKNENQTSNNKEETISPKPEVPQKINCETKEYDQGIKFITTITAEFDQKTNIMSKMETVYTWDYEELQIEIDGNEEYMEVFSEIMGEQNENMKGFYSYVRYGKYFADIVYTSNYDELLRLYPEDFTESGNFYYNNFMTQFKQNGFTCKNN